MQFEGMRQTEEIALVGKKGVRDPAKVMLDLGRNSRELNLSKPLAPMFDLRLRKLEILVFEGENSYGWIQFKSHFVVNKLAESEKHEVAVLC